MQIKTTTTIPLEQLKLTKNKHTTYWHYAEDVELSYAFVANVKCTTTLENVQLLWKQFQFPFFF